MNNLAILIAAVLFGLGALMHLGRLLCPFEISIDSFHLPLWASGVTFIFTGVLSAWLFRGLQRT